MIPYCDFQHSEIGERIKRKHAKFGTTAINSHLGLITIKQPTLPTPTVATSQ